MTVCVTGATSGPPIIKPLAGVVQGTKALSLHMKGAETAVTPVQPAESNRTQIPARTAAARMEAPRPHHDHGEAHTISCPHCHQTWEHERPSKKTAGLPKLCILLHADLPALWICKFLKEHLTSHERIALFRACKPLARLVVQHHRGLKLHPAEALRGDSKRRGWVLGLAAGCRNIHLHVQSNAVLLDTPAIWQCITQITLCDVGLSRPTISRLMLSQLRQLHTIQLNASLPYSSVHEESLGSGALDKLRSIIQSGALPALCTLGGKYKALCKLAPLVGPRITQLVVDHPGTLKAYASQWPKVEVMTIEHKSPGYSNYLYQSAQVLQELPQMQQELVNHPRLKHLAIAGSMLPGSGSSSSMPPPAWDSLEITGSLHVGRLASISLQHVQRLLLPGELLFREEDRKDTQEFLATLQGLRPHSEVVVKQDVWRSLCMIESSVQPDMQTLSLPFYPAVLECLFQKCTGLSGGLVLMGGGKDGGRKVSLGAHLSALAHIPEGIHTLLCSSWYLSQDGCSWIDVLIHIPAHVQHLLVQDCGLSEASWLAVLDHPAPTGLRRVTLASDPEDMSWVPWEGEELISMQALVATKWPHVSLEVDTTQGEAYSSTDESEGDGDGDGPGDGGGHFFDDDGEDEDDFDDDLSDGLDSYSD